MSIWDILGIPNISDILDVLKPNDADPQYKFLRSLGTGLLYLGIALFVIFLLIIAFTTPVLTLVIGIAFTILLMIVGAALLIYTHDDEKNFQEIEKEDKEAEASKKEAEAAREKLKTISEYERMPLDQRGADYETESKDDRGDSSDAPDMEEIGYEK